MKGPDGGPLRMEHCTPYVPPPMTPQEMAAAIASWKKPQD